MAKQVRIDPDTVYRSSTPLAQKRFPSRRRSIRSRATPSAAPPKLREQSTLTQLDWSFSTEPSSEVEIDDEGDGLEGVRPKRKKRRMIVGDGKKQATLTQMVGEGDGGCRLVGDSQSLLRCGYEEGGEEMSDQEQDQVQDQDQGLDQDQDQDQEVERVDSARGKAPAQPRPSPELSVSMPHLRTPRKRFPSEIPSSSTPQSAVLSMRSTRSRRSPERSPLRAKSGNVSFQPRPLEKAPLSPVLDTPPKAVSHFRLSPTKSRPIFRVPNKPPTLQHRSTIPDSEDTATQVSPAAKRKFRSQIPDTQFDMFGDEVTADTETQFNYSYDANDYETYDPACSALDRDAARFMQTQRLLDMHRHHSLRPLVFTQEEPDAVPPLEPEAPQLSQELGDHLPQSLHPPKPDPEVEASTESPPSSQVQKQLLTKREEIEVVDLTGDSFAQPQPQSDMDIIRIASSPTSSAKSLLSSSKYPSSPPPASTEPLATTTTSHRPTSNTTDSKNSSAPSSSPPLPDLPAPIPPSQISTVAGTQKLWNKARLAQVGDGISSSPPPLPPSTSSPPPQFRNYGKMAGFGIPDSEDEDDGEALEYDDEDGDLDLEVSFSRADATTPKQNPHHNHHHNSEETGGEEEQRKESREEGKRKSGREKKNDEDANEERSHDDDGGGGGNSKREEIFFFSSDASGGFEDESGRRLRDILPDTLLDFSLPLPPSGTQSSIRSLWK